MKVYRVYENYHHFDGEVGNYDYGTYSTLELAQARMEQVWKDRHYPTEDMDKYEMNWYCFDETMKTMYCVIIEPILVEESLERSITMTHITVIIPPKRFVHYPDL